MPEHTTHTFPLVDQYTGIHMDVGLSALGPGRVEVVETSRRLRKEQSYGFIHALWWIWLMDGRSAVSVPPGAGETLTAIVAEARTAEDLRDPDIAERLKPPVNDVLCRAGLAEADRVLRSLSFACNASLLRRHRYGHCRRLTDDSIPPAEGLSLPDHCFPDGIVYGVVADGAVVSVAFAHRSGCMEDQIADLGVETAPAHRRRGYAKTVVSAVVEHVTRGGGEARYACNPGNEASIATARSVGFVPYAIALVLSAPAPTTSPGEGHRHHSRRRGLS